ncbi:MULTISPECIES: DUF2865 domain-containing protein [unclassified Sinorhizobium]|uniref:DUF2865 domain-containing protein n=1 Tax=unclassified Sinorhizobium TaxID=2613772 RepID=UPI0024C3424F|nr:MULTISPECIES: DUF2865 domain-containing protein [unclassified Sinorhizobium]MDK1373112.1 DUF2865 domain-containing protein [Sinorhizobium sp. 6-70]MDK1479833.1 DUF2865 domain-containing protein [Sinorhizobium sp. 6-117]
MSRSFVYRKLTRAAAALLPALLAIAGGASASTVCERLNARLTDLSTVVTLTANLRDFTGAVSRQNIELRRAKNERRRMECSHGSVVVIGGDNDDACTVLDETIARMEDNLQKLKAHRRSLISGDAGDTRRRILAALELNGCHDEARDAPDPIEEQDEFASAAVDDAEFHRNILRDLPPDSEDYPLLNDDSDMQDFPLLHEEPIGSLRTMCVRTCDGAFFPISSNATPSDFARDAELCQARCPGAETELYYHVLETEETDQMVSASTGRPYTELPTAFAYRARGVGAPGVCGCRIPNGVATQDGGRATAGSEPSIITINGDREPAQGSAQAKPGPERPYDPANSKVRVVGPTFLPQEKSAIDLKHPLGPSYQPTQGN